MLSVKYTHKSRPVQIDDRQPAGRLLSDMANKRVRLCADMRILKDSKMPRNT